MYYVVGGGGGMPPPLDTTRQVYLFPDADFPADFTHISLGLSLSSLRGWTAPPEGIVPRMAEGHRDASMIAAYCPLLR